MTRSKVSNSFDPARRDFTPYGLTCVHWTPSPMHRPDHHNEIELNFIESGWVTYLIGGCRVQLNAGELSAFWAAIPHQIIDFGENAAYYVATIPLPWFLQWRTPPRFSQALMRGGIVTDTSPSRTHSDRYHFAEWEKDLKNENRAGSRVALLEIQARLLRLARDTKESWDIDLQTSGRSGPVVDGLNRVERMACFMAQHYTERITVQDISSHVQLHPNYAMNLFHRTVGMTLINYLTQHRLSHAQRLLATTDDCILNIAFDSGFHSISRFNDAFRRACGCAPREYRSLHRNSQHIAS